VVTNYVKLKKVHAEFALAIKNCRLNPLGHFTFVRVGLFSMLFMASSCGYLHEEFLNKESALAPTVEQSVPLAIQPAELDLSKGSAPETFSFSGGVPNYSFSFLNCDFCELDELFKFKVPWIQSDDVKLILTDALGNNTQAAIRIAGAKILQFGGDDDDRGRSVKVHPETGDIYLAGSTRSILGTGILGAGQQHYLSKYNKYGEHQWTRQYGTAGHEVYESFSMGLFSNGDVLLGGFTTGAYSGYANLGGGWSGYDHVLYRISSEGELVWLKQYAHLNDTIIYQTIVDKDDFIYLSGWTKATIGGVANLGDPSGYVGKYDSSGDFIAHVSIGHAGGGSTPRGLVVSEDGSKIFAGGGINGSMPGFTSAGGTDAFVVALDKDLNILWKRQYGTAGSDFIHGKMVYDAATDSVFAGGRTTGTFAGQTSFGGQDAYLAKLKASDGTIVNIWQYGTAANDATTGIAQLSTGEIVVVGATEGALSGFTSAGGEDVALWKISAETGVVLSTYQNGSSGSDAIYSLDVVQDKIYAVGSTAGTFDLSTEANQGSFDGFLIKLDADLTPQ